MGWLIVVIIAATALVAWLIWASMDIGSGVYVKAFCAHTEGDAVSLTFDDGPDPLMTPRVLEVLRRYDVRATFFLVGERAATHPELVRRIVAEGHAVGGHSYTHAATLPLRSARWIEREIVRTRTLLEGLIGEPVDMYRPPFGVTNPMVGRAIRRCGVQVAGWSIRSLDTCTRWSRARICRRIVRRLRPGAVILLHDRVADADQLLEQLLKALREGGYPTRVMKIERREER